MSVDLSPIASAAVTAAAGVVGTLAAAAIPLLPRLWVWLRVSVEGSDATRLRYAIDNAAQGALRAIRDGQPQDRAVDEMVAYAQANLPRAIARLQVPRETLQTMCEAALARLMAAGR